MIVPNYIYGKISLILSIWREIYLELPHFIFGGAPKSLQMVTAAMKLKDAYSLEGKL